MLDKPVVPVLGARTRRASLAKVPWLAKALRSSVFTLAGDGRFDAGMDKLAAHLRDALASQQQTGAGRGPVEPSDAPFVYSSGRWRATIGSAVRFSFFRLMHGSIMGQGDDVVGAFTIAGSYTPAGACEFIKRYVGKHKVNYRGSIAVGHGGLCTMDGTWSIRAIHDKFRLQWRVV